MLFGPPSFPKQYVTNRLLYRFDPNLTRLYLFRNFSTFSCTLCVRSTFSWHTTTPVSRHSSCVLLLLILTALVFTVSFLLTLSMCG